MVDVLDQEIAEKAVDNYDPFVRAEVCITDEQGRKIMAGVTKCVKDNEGNNIGIEHPVLFSDQSLYEVSFPNGQTEDMTANVIAENILTKVDSEVHHYQVLKEISNQSKDGSLLKRSDGFIRSSGRNPHDNKTNKALKLEVKCKDGTLSWIPLKDLKPSNPVELAEYSVANNIEDEPIFK